MTTVLSVERQSSKRNIIRRMGGEMSYDYIPQTDYSGTRAERRRKEKEATRSMYKGERKLNPSQHQLNRQHRRHPTHDDKLVMWKEEK